jgi:hypothetical protein
MEGVMRAWRVLTAVALFVALLAPVSGARADEQIDPAAIAKAKELLAVTKSVQAMNNMVDPMFDAVGKLLEAANPGRGAEIRDLMATYFIPDMRKRLPELGDLIAEEWAHYFTVDDMDKLIGFYQTDLGQKLLAAQPKLSQEAFKLGQAWGEKVAGETFLKMEPELKKRGLKSPNI